MTPKMTLQEVAELAASTQNAYSFERYDNWTDCVLALAIAGYSRDEAETILRSKWMRWAGDHSDREYGTVKAADMMSWIEAHGSREQLHSMMHAA